MGATARAVLRGRLVSVVLVALAIAVLFGGSLAALAGTDRSSNALAGLLAYSAPEDVFVAASSASAVDMAAVDALPEVLGTEYQEYLAMVPIGLTGSRRPNSPGASTTAANFPFQASLDEATVFTSQLTAAQVSFLYFTR